MAGRATFTQVLPFKLPTWTSIACSAARLERVHGCVRSLLRWDSLTYRFHLLDGRSRRTSVQWCAAIWRQRRADGQLDAFVLHLINYGPNTNWADIACKPQSIDDLAIQLPLDGATGVQRVFVASSPAGDQPSTFFARRMSAISLSRFEYYALIVVELSSAPTLPQPLPAVPEIDAFSPEPYDIGGNALWEGVDQIIILDEAPVFAISTLDAVNNEVAFGDST